MHEATQRSVEIFRHLSHGEGQAGIIRFLDSNIRMSSGFSVVQEFPSLFGDYPGGESLLIKMKDQIASHVGYVVRDFQFLDGRMKIGLVGSVATAPEFRNRGLASTLLTRAALELKRRGAVIALLWTDKNDFYAPLGFFRTGREIDFRFSSRRSHSSEKPIEFEPKKHTNFLWRLYQKHDVKLDRSLEEQKKLCAIPRSRIYVTERDGVLTSYIVVNKGADFEDWIHEWAGDLEEVGRNIESVQTHVYPNQNLTLIAPAHYDLSPIRRLATLEWEGVLGLAKILDRPVLMNLYISYLKRLGVEHTWDRNHERFEMGGQVFSTKEDADILGLVFGECERSSHPVLPLFLWGYDSI